MHSFFFSSQNNGCGKVHHALYRVTMLPCVLVVPPQDQVMSIVPSEENISTPLLSDFPLQQTRPPVLRRKRGICDLRAAFRKLQRPTRGSCASSTDTSKSSASGSALSIDPASLLSVSDIFETAHSLLSCSYGEREGVADRNERTTPEPSQHTPTPVRLLRKTALNNLRGVFKLHDRTLEKVSDTPLIDETRPTAPTSPPVKSGSEAVALSQADRHLVYISLPLPPPLRHEEVVADIPFVPRPLMRGVPVHARARTMHTDLTIPHIWRGRSARYH